MSGRFQPQIAFPFHYVLYFIHFAKPEMRARISIFVRAIRAFYEVLKVSSCLNALILKK